jgi:signal transduction histidine kinase
MAKRLRDLVRTFRQLRWKLTLSHTLVTVVTLLTVEIILIAGAYYLFGSNIGLSPAALFEELETYYLPIARLSLTDPSMVADGAAASLGQLRRSLASGSRSIMVMGNIEIDLTNDDALDVYFVQEDGTLVYTIPVSNSSGGKIGHRFEVSKIPGLETPLNAALNGERDYRRLYTVRLPEYRVVGALPVISTQQDRRVLGALAFTTESLARGVWPLESLLPWIGASLLVFTLLAGAAGTVFGSLTARDLVRRLQEMSQSTSAWSRGDFGVHVEDPAGDELGRLAGELNQMAQQLEHLLDRRQELSIIEERNRLARDLHDSAKQQAFAASAQLAAARTLWSQNPEIAEAHLREAENLVDQVRQELTYLIQELRPSAFTEVSLGTALHDYALDWSNQTGITVTTRIHCDQDIPVESEHLLFRIAQEALANVARHSQAHHVELTLERKGSSATLTISDDGRGFDPEDRTPGLGLRSMRERAEMLGGQLIITSQPSLGTQVFVICPD